MLQKQIAVLGVMLIFTTFVNPRAGAAREHVVPLREIQRQVEARSEAVARDRADIERVLALPAARDTLRKSNIASEQVHTAVAMLSPEELSRFAAQARLVEKDVEGGIIVGILALIGLVVVILIVLAVVNN